MAGQAEKPPAQPTYVLRGHSVQIHAVHFLRHNSRLLTGDADGWVVLWSTTTKRGVAVWKAHRDTILGLGSWGRDNIITHGRDNKLNIWQLKSEDESDFTAVLPVDDPSSERKQPWLLHSLTVNALNFCTFSACPLEGQGQILIATPGVQDGHVNVNALPSETRIATVPGPKDTNTGMLMATGIHILTSSQGAAHDHDYSTALLVLAGYESGQVCAWRRQASRQWAPIYLAKPHAQPVLSLDIAPGLDCFFTSSADAVIARHPLLPDSGEVSRVLQTRHAGQQSLVVRSDEKIFATAGWDGRVRVYSSRSLVELAVLKWHKEGCYALAFAQVTSPAGGDGEDSGRAEVVPSSTTTATTVSALRTRKAESTHWIAAGSKDGRVSLWDIY